MSGWDSYRAVYGAELRAAAREFTDHGWQVIESDGASLDLVTGVTVDVLEVPAALGRRMCAHLRGGGMVVPVAATPTGSWYYPVTVGAELPGTLAVEPGVVLHSGGAAVAMPPSTVPDGWVHWRVAPAVCGYTVPSAEQLLAAAVAAAGGLADVLITTTGTPQRPAGMVVVGMRR